MYKQIEAFLISINLISRAQLKWERIAGVWLFCTIAAMALLLIVAILDIVFLNRLLFPVLRVVGTIGFGSMFGAVFLYIAASNLWIQ